MTPIESVDAVVVGGGPSGLAAAAALRRGGAGRVVVVEREELAGGVPRHCAHTGFGVRDLHRVLTGPAYARRWVARAAAAGVEIRTSTMVTAWSPGAPSELSLTGPGGRRRLQARAVVLATGARERPRSARLVPGDRPAGVMTTGQLQQLVQLRLPVGARAVVVGAEHVSYSAVVTLRHAGVDPVAMVTDLPASQSFAIFGLSTRWGFRVPLRTETDVVSVEGHGRVAAVVLRSRRTGRVDRLPVDTVVFTGDWIPDHELARSGRLTTDGATLGPEVDAAGATSQPGVWAVGNLVHPVETADVAASRATVAGRAAAAWLRAGGVPGAAPRRVPVLVDPPIRWTSPDVVGERVPQAPPPVLFRVDRFVEGAVVVVEQDGALLARTRPRRLLPNRSLELPAGWLSAVRSDAGPVHVRVVTRSAADH